ncbi:ABC transporter ATP-binding protein [Plantactinospora sp. S1510]|uniref:ABC transporter ATP-binding protein n=1 Tax=Plantactinospora alkalitolerans TaxID=2789879 RepID=A0ABS0GW53_9ACTN|nr:ABC transporter ATP-binding protein [Plantactinospora alkalitolerans]MBF9130306.1 ABC transporter ATP-binding protein [Plantactinospora alkalitolerans]
MTSPPPAGAPVPARRVVALLARPRRRELLRIAVVLPVKLLATIAVPLLVGRMLDRGIPALVERRWSEVALLAGLLLTAAVAELALTYRVLYQVSALGQEMLFELRCRVASAALGQSSTFRDRHHSGEAFSRAGADVQTVGRLFDAGPDGLVTRLLTVVVIGAVLPFVDGWLACLTVSALAPVAVLLGWVRRRGGRAHRDAQRATADLTTGLLEATRVVRVLQAFGAQERAAAALGRSSRRYRHAHQRALLLAGLFPPAVRLAGNTAVAAVLVVGAYRIAHGHASVGEVTAFLLFLRRLVDPLQDLASVLETCQAAVAALERLGDLVGREPDGVPRPAGPDRRRAAAPGGVELRDIWFSYAGRSRPALRGVSFRIAEGETVALVGATGAGKSTIAKLLTRAYHPARGTVLLGGVDLGRVPEDELRRAVVPVLQETFVFTATVEENVALARPGASDEEVVRACRLVGADRFIARLPDGYQTRIGRSGYRLSAGQEQLIALARVCLAEPVLVVLDEATAALDAGGERTVQDALRKLLAGRTALLIAHRFTALRLADRVVVVDDGKVVEQGSVAALSAAGGDFARQSRAWRAVLAGDLPPRPGPSGP